MCKYTYRGCPGTIDESLCRVSKSKEPQFQFAITETITARAIAVMTTVTVNLLMDIAEVNNGKGEEFLGCHQLGLGFRCSALVLERF